MHCCRLTAPIFIHRFLSGGKGKRRAADTPRLEDCNIPKERHARPHAHLGREPWQGIFQEMLQFLIVLTAPLNCRPHRTTRASGFQSGKILLAQESGCGRVESERRFVGLRLTQPNETPFFAFRERARRPTGLLLNVPHQHGTTRS